MAVGTPPHPPRYSISAALVGGAFSLPGARGIVSRLYSEFLAAPGLPPVDFALPTGEAALVPSTSVSWQVFDNPISVLIGGVAAVLMELAEPRVGEAVWHYSDFQRDPKRRLQRTGLAAMVTVYGAKSVATRMIEGVVRQHARVKGIAADGQTYRASDPMLLAFVQVTAMAGFFGAYRAFVLPLTQAEGDAYFAEGQAAAALYGATGVPATLLEAERFLTNWADQLHPTDRHSALFELLAAAPILPRWVRSAQRSLLRAATTVVPETCRRRMVLPPQWIPTTHDIALARWLAQVAAHLSVDSRPRAVAARRVGNA